MSCVWWLDLHLPSHKGNISFMKTIRSFSPFRNQSLWNVDCAKKLCAIYRHSSVSIDHKIPNDEAPILKISVKQSSTWFPGFWKKNENTSGWAWKTLIGSLDSGYQLIYLHYQIWSMNTSAIKEIWIKIFLFV